MICQTLFSRTNQKKYFKMPSVDFSTPPHDVAGYYGFTLDVRVSCHPSVSRPSVRPSVFRFRVIT